MPHCLRVYTEELLVEFHLTLAYILGCADILSAQQQRRIPQLGMRFESVEPVDGVKVSGMGTVDRLH